MKISKYLYKSIMLAAVGLITVTSISTMSSQQLIAAKKNPQYRIIQAVVSTQNIKGGTVITSSMITIKTIAVHSDDFSPLTKKDEPKIIGRTLASNLRKGMLFYHGYVSQYVIGKNRTYISIVINGNKTGIRKKDHVDILKEIKGKPIVIALKNLEVLDVRKSTENEIYDKSRDDEYSVIKYKNPITVVIKFTYAQEINYEKIGYYKLMVKKSKR